jgi:hypothetical protein
MVHRSPRNKSQLAINPVPAVIRLADEKEAAGGDREFSGHIHDRQD